MIFHEGGAEVVAVIIARRSPERCRIAPGLAGLLEQLAVQFLLKRILGSLIHQQGGGMLEDCMRALASCCAQASEAWLNILVQPPKNFCTEGLMLRSLFVTDVTQRDIRLN